MCGNAACCVVMLLCVVTLLVMYGNAGVSGNAACYVWQSCLPCVVMLLAMCGNAACYVW